MRIVYDIFFIIFSIFYLPYFLLKGKYHRDYLQRFGVFGKDIFSSIAPTKPIWLHAVSVGEMKTADGLIAKMRRSHPSRRFVISNVTRTGHEIAVSVAAGEDLVIYFPMDLSFVVKRLVELINPSLFIAIETEIWPNLIYELYERGIPIVLMNGRISPRSFRNYRLVRPIMRRILQKITLFCMRTEQDALRIKELGAPAEKVKVSGNMKFDSVFIKDEKELDEWALLRNKSKWLDESSKLIIAGSTHRGEDAKMLGAYMELKKDFPELRLLIAPRHVERTEEIGELVEKSGFRAVRISEIEEKYINSKNINRTIWNDNSVFILDSIGRLSSLYKLATVVFVGGSLTPHGGQNFIEPAVHAKPIVTGPHLDNFKDMSELFARNSALEIVYNEKELVNSLRSLLSDRDRRKAMGERAKKVVFDNMGSTDRNILLIRQFLNKSSEYAQEHMSAGAQARRST